MARSKRMSAHKRLRERRKAARAELDRAVRSANVAAEAAVPAQLTLPLSGAPR